jgi:hypothetical protein
MLSPLIKGTSAAEGLDNNEVEYFSIQCFMLFLHVKTQSPVFLPGF